MSRRLIILKLLRDRDDPIRRAALLKVANEDRDFRKASGQAFWSEDFSWFMKDLISDGQVEKIAVRSKVWYVLTQIGMDYLLKVNEPKTFRSVKLRQIRHLIKRRFNYTRYHSDGEETKALETKIANLKGQIEDGDNYVQSRYYKELVLDGAQRSDWGDRSLDMDLLEFVKRKVDWTDDMDAKLLVDIQKQIEWGRRQAEARDGFYAECVKCGGRIHRGDVVKVADELAERLGVETGSVCCTCYDGLMEVN